MTDADLKQQKADIKAQIKEEKKGDKRASAIAKAAKLRKKAKALDTKVKKKELEIINLKEKAKQYRMKADKIEGKHLTH